MHICTFCNSLYVPKKSNQMYCSPPCRHKARAHKDKCSSMVNDYIRRGKMIRGTCEVCGVSHTKRKKVHGHHDDYSKPLQVRWLCAKHHTETHRLMRLADKK